MCEITHLAEVSGRSGALSNKLSTLEARLAKLKASPSPSSTPLLQAQQSPQPEASSRKITHRPSVTSVPGGLSGCMRALSEPREDCVDFDYCFKIASPTLVEYLKAEAKKTEGVPVAQQKARQKAVEDAANEALCLNAWFCEELRKRAELVKSSQPRHRFPTAPPGNQKASDKQGPIPAQEINRLIGDIFREKRDRKALTCIGKARDMQQARILILSLLLEFFGREEEPYQTFIFRSVDSDEVFLCVKMCEETAELHAAESKFMVELSYAEVAKQLNVKIPDSGTDYPAYAHFKPYLHQAGLIEEHAKESNPLRKVIFNKVDRIALLYDRMTDVLDVDAMKQWNLLLDFFPLHTLEKLQALRAEFTAGKWLFEAPFDEVRQYYGSQIALYFVFSCLLCKHLVWLVLISWISAAYVALKTRSLEEAFTGFLYGHCHPEVRFVLAMSTIIWSLTFTFKLKSQVSRWLVKWGEAPHLGFSQVKPRESPRFAGMHCTSEVDSMLEEVNVPQEVKARGRIKSRMLTSIFALCVCAIMASIYLVAAWIDNNGYGPGFRMAGFVITLAIKILQAAWDSISNRLVDIEYHHYEVDYFDSWSSKTVIIQMICNFSPFVYVGFVMKYVDQCPTTHGAGCFGYLCYEMVIVFLLYIVFTLWDIIYPIVVIKVQIWSEAWAAKRRGAEVQGLSFLEKQSKMAEYDSAALAEDFCEHIMPLSFVLLFGTTLPCSPILALISSWLQVRADAYKLTTAMQRPFPVKAKQGLGIWGDIVDTISVLSVYTNCGIISFLMEPLSHRGWRSQWLAFLSFSTGALVLRRVIEAHMPEEDGELKMIIKRQERQMEVVHGLQAHYMDSLVVRKPTKPPHGSNGSAHRKDPPPEQILSNVENAIKPLKLAIHSDLDMNNIPGLESDSKYFETF